MAYGWVIKTKNGLNIRVDNNDFRQTQDAYNNCKVNSDSIKDNIALKEQFQLNDGKLVCLYANVRSIVNKRSELDLYVLDDKPDIIGITESWTTEDIQDSELNIDGYTMFRKDRISKDKNKIRGGGVLLFVRHNLNVILREDLESEIFQECIWCDVKIGKEITLIGVCYRCPNKSKENDEALFDMINKASVGKLMLMGDFNFPVIKWNNPESLDDSHPFLKCVNDKFLFQHVEESTRGKNILDLVFTSEENMIENLKVGELFGTSDHQIIRWTMLACKEVSPEIKFYDYTKVDYDKMRSEVGLQLWDKIISGNNVENDWNGFKKYIENIRDKLVPHKNEKVKNVNG